jgi:hypothetical protein
MVRAIGLILILAISGKEVFCQGKANSLKGTPFKERIVTGGGMGLGFGSTQDFISVSPVIGYRLTQKLIAGTNFTYRYTSYKVVTPSIKLNDYGVGPFLRFTVYRNIFIQTEYEYLNYEYPISAQETLRYDFKSFLGGGGFIQPISKNVAFYLVALYNFSYKDPAPNEPRAYNSPLIVRGGINIGNFGF